MYIVFVHSIYIIDIKYMFLSLNRESYIIILDMLAFTRNSKKMCDIIKCVFLRIILNLSIHI